MQKVMIYHPRFMWMFGRNVAVASLRDEDDNVILGETSIDTILKHVKAHGMVITNAQDVMALVIPQYEQIIMKLS